MYWPHREQARSHRVLWCVEDLGQSTIYCGSEPARDGGVSGDSDGECAGLIAGKPAHRVLWCVEDLGQSAIHCGSEPARDGGVSGDIDGECTGLIASRLAPTGFCGVSMIWVSPQSTVGSEPARDGGVSGNKGVGCAGLIASRLAPTGFCGVSRIWVSPPSTVGVSLLAMAVYLAILMVNVLASSRASPLPQGLTD